MARCSGYRIAKRVAISGSCIGLRGQQCAAAGARCGGLPGLSERRRGASLGVGYSGNTVKTQDPLPLFQLAITMQGRKSVARIKSLFMFRDDYGVGPEQPGLRQLLQNLLVDFFQAVRRVEEDEVGSDVSGLQLVQGADDVLS